ncbi:hypothetical protein AAIH25_17470 [Arthrobacter crystallopoietes]|uniref:hypothetical protein n=1 Tax=Crystallibacter crystallopoietes TaxID=37928 RepID=UPI003D208CF7
MGTRWMERSGSKSMVRFRRARAVLILVIVFWIWLLLGGAGGLDALAESPKALVLVLYASAVVVPVSALAGLTAGAIMLAEWPRRSDWAAGRAWVSVLARTVAPARVTLVRLPTLRRIAALVRVPVPPRPSASPRLANSAAGPMLASRRPAPKAATEPAQDPATPRTIVPARPPLMPAGIPAPPVRLPGPPTRMPAPPTCPPSIGTAGNARKDGSSAT